MKWGRKTSLDKHWRKVHGVLEGKPESYFPGTRLFLNYLEAGLRPDERAFFAQANPGMHIRKGDIEGVGLAHLILGASPRIEQGAGYVGSSVMLNAASFLIESMYRLHFNNSR